MYKSKMVIVIYPRKRRMTKEQLVQQAAITGVMSLMSIGGKIESSGREGGGLELRFPISGNPNDPGLPQNWFTGDSHFRVEVKRITNTDVKTARKDYQSLYHWCKEAKIPVFCGEEDSEATMMVIGPYWVGPIEKILSRAFPFPHTVKDFAAKPKDEE